MAFAEFEGNRFRIDGEIAKNHAILVNMTASRPIVVVQDPGTQNFEGVDTASCTFLMLFFCQLGPLGGKFNLSALQNSPRKKIIDAFVREPYKFCPKNLFFHYFHRNNIWKISISRDLLNCHLVATCNCIASRILLHGIGHAACPGQVRNRTKLWTSRAYIAVCM